MLVSAGSGHSAGPLDMADVFTALYFCVLRYDTRRPEWPDRDRLVLSAGHLAPVLYAVLAHAGYFPVKELHTLRKINSRLQGHPHNRSLPGIENTSGPLGQGLSQSIGMALAGRLDGRKYEVYCVMSDGEQQEGQVWEAVMFAGKNKIANLTAFIDRNNIQIDGPVEDIMPIEPLRKKYESFNWHVLEVDGHNIQQIIDACHTARAIWDKPVAIICHTIPGKGVGFMEFDFHWHGKPPEGQEAVRAMKDLNSLRTLKGKITSEHE
ncbi:MAG: Transketolase domain protein [Parcubacteria group bacterium GW2011_GWC2_49_9]|nr:MAG: Transketolase domain protein [Parcubacteria group bacterium GW2011_GWC2_49_9]